MTKTAPHFHVGILVADIQAAIKRFSDVFDIGFTEPVEQHVTLRDPEPVDCRIRAVYSLTESPYLELIEAHGDGALSLKNGEGLHHIGLWAPDFDTYQCSEIGAKLPAGPQFCLASESPTMWLTNPADLHGVRLEWLNEALRPGFEAGMAAGRMNQ